MAYVLQNILGLQSKLKTQLLVSPGNPCRATVHDVIVHGLMLGYVFMSPFCVCLMHVSFKLACPSTLMRDPVTHTVLVLKLHVSAQCTEIRTVTGVNLFALRTRV